MLALFCSSVLFVKSMRRLLNVVQSAKLLLSWNKPNRVRATQWQLWGRGAPGMHTEKGSALSPGRRRRRMVTLQVPHQSPKRTFSVVFDQWDSHDNLQQHEEKRCKKLKTGDRITPHLCSVHTEWWQETGSSTSVILRRKNQVMTTL